MKQNVVIWRFHDEMVYPALIELAEEGFIDIKAWLGDSFRCPYCTHDIYNLLRHLHIDYTYHPIDWDVYQKVYPSLLQFIKSYYPRRRLYFTKTMHDFTELFPILFNFFYHLLTQQKIDAVLFGFIPHQGPELVLYEIAKALKIKTFMVLQSSNFPNKFFYSFTIDDFGVWDHNFTTNSDVIHVEKNFQKKLVRAKQQKLRAPDGKDWEKLKRSIRKVKMKMQHYDLFDDVTWRILLWKKQREYRRNLTSVCQEVNFNENFVYFPLHYQPELTTEILGGIYVDQLLAIERLHDMLPDGWYIYVKDYPRLQTAITRPPAFFQRLRALPKVRVVHSKVDTYQLMQACVFVATITGTAGWEAVSGGKNALVFGQAWYKSLPGVFSYSPELKLEEILEYKINHEELEKQVGIIQSKMGDGIVTPQHTVLYKDFDKEKNLGLLKDFFLKVLEK